MPEQDKPHDNHEIDEVTGQETTGHEWDGIRELDTPLPRWWLNIFYATILVAVVYWILMPAWPGIPGVFDHTTGVRNHSDRAILAQEVAALDGARQDNFDRLSGLSMDEIQSDPELLAFARAAGESVFGSSCATCHGRGGQGQIGYPNLQDDVWLWSGTLDGIIHTLNVGIRSDHPQARMSDMPNYGLDGLLSDDQINDVTDYVVQISSAATGETADAAAAARGQVVFQAQCVSCHGAAGAGDPNVGAPSLIDNVWLYGGSREDIRTQIVQGRGGVMPAWSGVYDDNTIRALAIYVYAMGGGQPEPAPQPVAAPSQTPEAPNAQTPLR